MQNKIFLKSLFFQPERSVRAPGVPVRQLCAGICICICICGVPVRQLCADPDRLEAELLRALLQRLRQRPREDDHQVPLQPHHGRVPQVADQTQFSQGSNTSVQITHQVPL